MDISHPLCYGYSRKNISVFKEGETVAESLNQPYSEPVRFTSEPLISGYSLRGNTDRITFAPVVSVQNFGRGKVVSYYEDMDFRGYWLGTNKLFINSVFFAKVIR